MAVSAKIVGAAAFSFLLVSGVRAQQTQAVAAPSDRCQGTLCDLYYGARGNAADMTTAKPAAPAVAGVPAGATPLTVPSNPLSRLFGGGGSSASSGSTASTRPPPPPSEPATATNSYMHLGTGGVLGGGDQRCTGTVCDLFYGTSPEEPAAGQQQAVAGSASMAARGEAPVVGRHIPHESETRPKCSSLSADPWRCYR